MNNKRGEGLIEFILFLLGLAILLALAGGTLWGAVKIIKFLWYL